jgi:hypothetical protein
MSPVFSADPRGGDSAPNGLNLRGLFIPALICAIASVVLIRSGLLSLFFLIPLGYGAAVYGPAVAWLAFISAAILNGGLSLGAGLMYQTGAAGMWIDILHYTVMSLGFTWIMAGGTGGVLPQVRTMHRFVAASVLGALSFLFVGYSARNNAGFAAFIESQVEALSALYISSSGADAARRSLLEHTLTTERVLEAISLVALRGGALASAFVIFFINRQAAWTLAWIFRRRRSGQSLGTFHAPAGAIWVLSLSLAAVLFSNIVKMKIPEIAAWNILVVCAILFLAQGGGIALYTLSRRPVPPVLRLIFNITIVVVVFSPGINTAALGLLILLGIAENWLPLRAPKTNGPASTPGL